eukprot:1438535-Alexandrium_andersonii.AAC.1
MIETPTSAYSRSPDLSWDAFYAMFRAEPDSGTELERLPRFRNKSNNVNASNDVNTIAALVLIRAV